MVGDAVFLRDVVVIFIHPVLEAAIAAKHARRRLVAGSCGKPNAGIDPARKGVLPAVNKDVVGDCGSVRNNKPLRTLLRKRLARVISRVVVQV